MVPQGAFTVDSVMWGPCVGYRVVIDITFLCRISKMCMCSEEISILGSKPDAGWPLGEEVLLSSPPHSLCAVVKKCLTLGELQVFPAKTLKNKSVLHACAPDTCTRAAVLVVLSCKSYQ